MLCCDVFQRENDFGCFGFLLASGVQSFFIARRSGERFGNPTPFRG